MSSTERYVYLYCFYKNKKLNLRILTPGYENYKCKTKCKWISEGKMYKIHPSCISIQLDKNRERYYYIREWELQIVYPET